MSVGPSAYWYLTRASGTVALVLLTASVVIGIAAIARLRAPGVPRFVVDGIHRTASLLAVAFLGVHIVTAALDSFASISLLDAVIPFVGSYRPVWLGLGTVGCDLLLAVALTSIVRERLGHATWRGVHWLSYAAWPVAVVHGLGTGSDVHQRWLQAITVACILAVLTAVVGRTMIGWPANLRLRVGALAMSAVFAGGLAVWLPGGPLGTGWARRAGTPPSLLGHPSTPARHG
ncbi:MAG TPA: ferric reductase-like transmembrane domain-containing protein [Solirubrobacteraceae bacterium]|nr:ferric reductase-like transmembrane domain-containing protein [Solirubrobacteraceae bacterium]